MLYFIFHTFVRKSTFLWLLLLLSLTGGVAMASSHTAILKDNLELLLSKSNNDKLQAIDNISRSDSPEKRRWLEALLVGELYQRKSDNELVFATGAKSQLSITSVSTGKDLGTVKKRKLRKLKINNKLRNHLHNTLAGLDLSAENSDVRLAAIKRLLSSENATIQARIAEMARSDSSQEIREIANTALAIVSLRTLDDTKVKAAIDILSLSFSPETRSALKDFTRDGSNAELVSRAENALANIERSANYYAKIETVFFGLSTGSILVMCAIGLAITFGVMGVINMAHGELMMLGAYTTYFVQQLMPAWIEYSLLIALPAAFLVAGSTGVIIERLVIRHLYGRPLETLLATFGISLLLQQAVRTLVSPQNVIVENPQWMSGAWEVNPLLSLTYNRLFIIIFAMLVFVVLLYVLRYSSFGLRLRAVAQNRRMARAMGIPSARIDSLTFGLGAGVAGLAGVALSQISNVGPNLGQAYIIDSFLVVVFGGVGNLFGTLIGGLSLGIGTKLLEPSLGAVMAKVLILVGVILFIQKRPRGLFPQRGRASEA